MKYFLYIFFYCLPVVAFAQPHTFYVKHNAMGTNTGTTWANAFTVLNSAIQQAQYGDTIWVAAGTYRPTTGTSRDSSFLLKNGVRIFGGFNGSETALSQRNIAANITILSGDIGVSNDSTDNSYNVLTCFHADSTTILDGFTVQRGTANNTSPNEPNINRKRGGGLYLKPIVAGQDASPVLKNCHFMYNYAVNSGSAIFADGNSLADAAPVLSSCKFENNPGAQAVFYNIAKPNITRKITLDHNFWGDNGSVNLLVSYTRGDLLVEIASDTFFSVKGTAAITTVGQESLDSLIFRLSNCSFINNKDCRIRLLTFPLNYNHCYVFENCLFENNKTITIHPEIGQKVNFLKNSIVENDFFSIFNEVLLTVSNNHFEKLKSLQLAYSSLGGFKNNIVSGVQLFNLNSEIEFQAITNIEQCLFYDTKIESFPQNTLFQSCSFINLHAFSDTSNIFYPQDSLVFNSCVFSNVESSLPLIDTLSSATQYVRAENCVFEQSCAEILVGGGSELCNSSNVFEAALMFYDTAAGDFRLRPCSPGINMGDPVAIANTGLTHDLSNHTRIANGWPDAGAYETLMSIGRDTVIDSPCSGQPGGAVVYGVDACPPFTYNWVNSAGVTGAQVDQLSAGIYEITVTGDNGLILLDTFTVGEYPVQFTLDSELFPASAPGVNDGAITTEVTDGGTGPFQYLWSNGATERFIENIPSGSYELTITDANGCTATYSFVLGTVSTSSIHIPSINTYPNPAKAGQILHFTGIEGGALQLFDLAGRSVALLPCVAAKVTLPATLPAGVYTGLVTDVQRGLIYRIRIGVAGK